MSIPNVGCLWQFVPEWARIDPEAPALRFHGERTSYGALDERTDGLAQALLERGVGRGDRVATILPPRPEYVETLIAANKIGAITVPLDVRFRSADLRRFLAAAEPRVLIAINAVEDHRIVDTLAEVTADLRSLDIVTLEADRFGPPYSELLTASCSPEQALTQAKADQRPEDGALIIFTGGTTGVPKAALLSQENVCTMCTIEAAAFQRYLADTGVTGRQTVLSYLPPSHVGGTLELMGAQLAAGAELVLMERWSPYPVLEATVRERLPLLGGVPTMMTILASLPDLDRYDLSCVKLAMMSGEKVSLELLQNVRSRLCRTIIVGYGSTEAGAEVTFTEPGDPLEKLAGGYVGQPLPGVEIKIVNDGDGALPPDEVGEVLVRGPLTIPGYFRMPEEDAKGFTADGFCRTGDLGYLDADGGLYIHGRKKHIIRVGSYTVMPTEIEEVVLQHPDVETAAAVGAPHAVYGEVVWLFAAPRRGRTLAEADLLDMCARQLADFKVPKKVLIRDELPLSRIGKADRAVLQQEVLQP